MSNVFTLDDLNQELENRYSPFVFQAGDKEFTLLSLMRVDKSVRKAVQERLSTMNDDDTNEDELVSALEFALSSVTKDRKGGALVRLVGGDLGKLMILLEQWQKATQPGEASSSPS
jgi:hypothetical protein